MLRFLHGFWHKFGAKGPCLMLGFLHQAWHQFGARCSYLMSGFLRCCCYTSGYQAKTTDFTIHHSIIARAFFCLEKYIYTRKRVMFHRISKYFSGIFHLVRNCVGQKGSRDIMELHTPGLHAKYAWGTICSQNARKTPDDYAKILLGIWQ